MRAFNVGDDVYLESGTLATIAEIDLSCPDGLIYRVLIDGARTWRREGDLNRQIKGECVARGFLEVRDNSWVLHPFPEVMSKYASEEHKAHWLRWVNGGGIDEVFEEV